MCLLNEIHRPSSPVDLLIARTSCIMNSETNVDQGQKRCTTLDNVGEETNRLKTKEESPAKPKSRITFMGALAKKFDSLRMRHFQISAVVVVTCFTSIQMYSLLTHSIDISSGDTPTPSIANAMLHLGSFASNFGAQMWVTFVAGLTMFYSLPRHMFGKVQSRLFPMFFLWSLVCSAVTLSTFLDRHPTNDWDFSRYVQVTLLSLGFLTAAINSLVLSPTIVSAMLETFQKEVEAGVGDIIGHTDVKELKKDLEYCRVYRRFRRCHALSGMLVVISLVCNTVYLYYLTSQCQNL